MIYRVSLGIYLSASENSNSFEIEIIGNSIEASNWFGVY